MFGLGLNPQNPFGSVRVVLTPDSYYPESYIDPILV